MKVIVPCCGRSTRYPDQPPKWTLPAQDGRPMIALAIEGLAVERADIIVTILKEHEDRFHVVRGLAQALGSEVRVLVLDEATASQAETVVRTIQGAALAEPFLVKDSDNTYRLSEPCQQHNYVCVDSLNRYDSINPRNKSYLQVDHEGLVTNIREKEVISDLFSVGGYHFLDPGQFVEQYERLVKDAGTWNRELYISDIIGGLILQGVPFRSMPVEGYEDWGTLHEWRRALLAKKAFFVLLDGFLFERGSRFFRPRFEEAKPNDAAVDAVKAAVRRGHSVRYLSVRPRELEAVTVRQIAAAGLPAADVLYECPVSAWVLLTAPHATLPFQTSHAIELAASDPHLAQKVLGE